MAFGGADARARRRSGVPSISPAPEPLPAAPVRVAGSTWLRDRGRRLQARLDAAQPPPRAGRALPLALAVHHPSPEPARTPLVDQVRAVPASPGGRARARLRG